MSGVLTVGRRPPQGERPAGIEPGYIGEWWGRGQRFGITTLTLYAFSVENWNRPKDEVDALMKYLESLTELLFGVEARDPWTFAAIAVLLGVIALVACLVLLLRRPLWCRPVCTSR